MGCFEVNIRNVRRARARKCDGGGHRPMAAAKDAVEITLPVAIVDGAYIIGQSRAKQGRGAFRFQSGQLVHLLPPCRCQRLRTTRLTRRIQRLDSRTISLFVRMVVTLGHRHRLMAGEVICLRYGEAKVQDGSMIQINILFEFPDSYLGISGSSRLVHISCVHSGSVSAILFCSSYNSTLIASRSCSVRDGGGVMSSRG